MVVTPPSNVTYSDFTINKTEFLPGEELTASMTYTNTGGYDMKTLAFVIFTKEDKKPVGQKQFLDVDIEVDSNETYTFKIELNFEPGEYVGAFCVNGKRLNDAPVFDIVIADPTAIDKVVSTPANDSKSDIYDLQGRPVKQMRKGGMYIIGKNKVVVK